MTVVNNAIYRLLIS